MANRSHRVLIPRTPEGIEGWGREILKGIAAYVQSGRPWEVRLVPSRFSAAEQIAHLEPDGVIAVVDRAQRVEAWTALGCPVVSVATTSASPRLPCVAADESAIGQLGAEHLIDRQFRQFGFVGYPGNPASEAREQGFFRTVAGLPGAARHTFESTGAPGAEDAKNIKPFDEQLGAWLKQLTPPIGLMAWNDAAAAVLVQTCARIGLSVPEQVAVIGVNDDEAWCGFCVPPLTSVRPPLKRIGYEGAQLLAQLMEGEPVPSEPLLLPPEGVHVRRSTDVLAVDDPVVARALRYIREHVSERINVADVVRHVRVSRRLLEDRFREHLGRSPLKEIHREQLRIADHLLRTTNLPPKVIATRAGYRDVNHLTRVFSKERGLPPATYRRECRME